MIATLKEAVHRMIDTSKCSSEELAFAGDLIDLFSQVNGLGKEDGFQRWRRGG